jgi:quinol monooxygenase YgiN
MTLERRTFLAGTAATAAFMQLPSAQAAQPMYGLIGKMSAIPGKRDELLAILLGSIGEMPGCLSYVVAQDATDANAIWITEVWDSEASHKASLAIPAVREAITKAKPMIASFDTHIATVPVGGQGLPKPR